MKGKTDKSIKKVSWTDELDYDEIDALLYVGVRSPKTLLDIRVFDLLNLFGIDMLRGRCIVYSLYKYYNHGSIEDELIDLGYKPLFDPKDWYKKHSDLSKVKVRDLVMAENINADALISIYDRVRKAFTDSDEYNWREYRYKHIRELKSSCKDAEEREKADTCGKIAHFQKEKEDNTMPPTKENHNSDKGKCEVENK